VTKEKAKNYPRIGISYLWWDVELTYWEEVTLYNDRQIIDYIYVTLGGPA
jgi:hypothetical protein